MRRRRPTGSENDIASWTLALWLPIAAMGGGIAATGAYFGLLWLVSSDLVPKAAQAGALNPYDIARSAIILLGAVAATIGLVFALRRQIVSERKLRIDRADFKHREQVEEFRRKEAKDAETQRRSEWHAERNAERIRDLRSRYVTCAQQLADPAEAVRLAGAYGMAQLATEWDDRAQMQSCIDVLCAYLRMPARTVSTFPGAPPAVPAGELEVRESIVKILVQHLRDEDDGFWQGASIDLSGAVLEYGNFSGCRFTGIADFGGARFASRARFDKCQFSVSADFRAAHFDQDVTFARARFEGQSLMQDARFEGRCDFASVNFLKRFVGTHTRFMLGANFSGAHFWTFVDLSDSYFGLKAGFASAILDGDVNFTDSTFLAEADFYQTRFSKGIGFNKSVFAGTFRFDESTVRGGAGFNETTFAKRASLQRSEFQGGLKLADVTASADLLLDWSQIRTRWTLDRSVFGGLFGVAKVTSHVMPSEVDTVYAKSPNWAAMTTPTV